MNKQPILICTLFFCLGIFIQDNFRGTEELAPFIPIIGFLTFGLGFIRKHFFDKFKSIGLVILFFCLGYSIHYINNYNQKVIIKTENKSQNITFELLKKLNSNLKNKRYEINILKIDNQSTIPIKSIISIPKEEKELNFKNYYSTLGYINPILQPKYNFNFNYQKYLARRNIHYQFYSLNEISSSPKSELNFLEKIKQKRLDILQEIDNSILSERTKNFLKGIILADRTEMDSETISSFSKTGLIHILAISGTHMAIIFMLILFVLKPFFLSKRIPIIISIISIWSFGVFIGFGSSVIRSCLMISIYYTLIFLQRNPNLLHSMALSALIILGIDSQQFFDIGFQLSFLAVFGIYWLNQPILNLFPKTRIPIYRFLLSTFSISLSAQIATLPLILYYFHQFSILSPFINLVAIPIAQIVIVFSFLMTILFGLGLKIDLIFRIYDFCVGIFLKIVNSFANIDIGFIENISIEIPEIILLFVLIYFLHFVLIKPNLKYFLKFSYIFLLFCGVRTAMNFYHWQKDEILTQEFYKDNIISVKEKDKILFIIHQNFPEEKLTHLTQSYLIHLRVRDFEVKKVSTYKIKINQETYYLK